MQSLLISLLLATTASGAATEQRFYVLGSSINLRKEPSKDAEALEKLPIGTECLVSEKLPGEWLKVRCGEKEGYASAPLLGPEKPSLEKLKAEANNPKLKLEQRLDSALRAASLAPEDAALQKQLGALFFERNLQLAAASKKPKVKRTFECGCYPQDDAPACIARCSGMSLRNVKMRSETRKNLFVAAISNGENVTVYRGAYRYSKKPHRVTGEVHERTSFASTPVMEKALFTGAKTTSDDDRLLPLGKYVLDENSQALLDAVPKTWGHLRGAGENLRMYWSDCLKRPFLLQFHPDMQGRWLFSVEHPEWDGGEGWWISAVTQQGNELALTLEDTEGRGKVTQHIFKLPESGSDQGALGKTLYSYELKRYPEERKPCREGGP
ncbi:MAG TPA: SH3 domain-containing protein [Myxococcaceae bacterium]|nr:SH3 domain-containing protein [Myxococcaceae bacterium]